MKPDSRNVERSCRRCLITGICSIAFPVSGAMVALLMSFALPSRLLHNVLADLLRIYYGVALLLPIPLAILTTVFFAMGISGLRRDLAVKGLGFAIIGLSLAVLSIAVFVTVVVVVPDL
ncbi:MAG TPA: hypothetical protein VIK22_10460 [Candidatus Anoxymicrobiaceae bacterium]